MDIVTAVVLLRVMSVATCYSGDTNPGGRRTDTLYAPYVRNSPTGYAIKRALSFLTESFPILFLQHVGIIVVCSQMMEYILH